MKNLKILAGIVCAGALIQGSSAALAQSYPERHVRILVGFASGGGTDVMARALAEKLSAALGRPVNVENRAGNAGVDAAELLVKSPADGHTLMMTNTSPHAIAPFMQKVGYDPMKDFESVAYMGYVPNVLVIHPSVPAKNVKELVSVLKASKSEIVFGSSGYASGQHLSGEIFKQVTGVKMTHRPFRGSGQSLNYLLTGEVTMIFDTTPPVMPHIKSGKLRALAVMTGKRAPGLDDVPTMKEAGFNMPEVSTWYGIVGPHGTPQPIVTRLNTEINKIMGMADVRQKLEERGVVVQTDTPAGFKKMMDGEVAKYRKVVAEAKLGPAK